ncbi:MAG: exopolysaccharide biosynthesis polyprenyl glycosylphosphotransferase [Spirochaetota bacterium]|nr:exopolysaccharide biosynthesis polyprenyl glycosylphosphotransferase [Spirochaetota bacterium]
MLMHRTKIYLKNIINKIILMALDFFLLIVFFFAAYSIRGVMHQAGMLSIPNPPIQHFYSYWYLLLIHIVFLYIFKIYLVRFSFWQEFKSIIQGISVGTVFVFFILALLKISQDVSRFDIIAIGIFAILILPLSKIFIKYILYKCGIWEANSLIIADPDEEFDLFYEGLKKNWYVGYSPQYVIRSDDIKDCSLSEYLIPERLESIIIDNNIILPILYKIDKDSFYDVFIKLDIFFDKLKMIPDLHSLFVNNISIENDGYNLIINFNNNLLKFHNSVVQYIFNRIMSIIIFLLLIPLFIIISIMIKIDSKGPVFYRARRIGHRDKDIYVYKFRTMFDGADMELEDLLDSDPEIKSEYENCYKIRRDPRITRCGRFLRKRSLDELPQIFNVLMGEMNLVGPRPIVRDEVEKYGEAFPELIRVKPGITGLWQISGRNDLHYEKRVELDLFYIKNWSLWMDMMILAKTSFVAVKGDGAY